MDAEIVLTEARGTGLKREEEKRLKMPPRFKFHSVLKIRVRIALVTDK